MKLIEEMCMPKALSPSPQTSGESPLLRLVGTDQDASNMEVNQMSISVRTNEPISHHAAQSSTSKRESPSSNELHFEIQGESSKRNDKMALHNLLTPETPSPLTMFPDIRTKAQIPETILDAKSMPGPLEPKSKRPWTEAEDNQLRQLVGQLGHGLWAAIAAQIPGRSGKQVRERWLNHLSPNITKRPWSCEEDEIILENHRRFGNSWSRIAKLLKGRSDNSVKNRFYTTLRRRIAPRGIGKQVAGRVRRRVWE